MITSREVTASHLEADKAALAGAVGEFLKYWGFKEIYGKIWVHVFLADEPVTASQLVRDLNVTKGLISMALAEMLDYGVIERVHLGNAKSPGYVSATDLEKAITTVLRAREQKILSQVHECVLRLKEHGRSNRNLMIKIKRLEAMTALAVDSLNRLLSHRVVPTWRWHMLMKLVR